MEQVREEVWLMRSRTPRHAELFEDLRTFMREMTAGIKRGGRAFEASVDRITAPLEAQVAENRAQRQALIMAIERMDGERGR